ncbi:MMPL family transporter [Cohnella faecalis]|uniref:MMPL family transporter n=1 Tax=Cohnella faecalis TaxID=2315694 RepID=UPI001F43E1DA|nr:MMPL family transporter [Cohnella faecalis]
MTIHSLRKMVQFASSRRGSKIIVLGWLLLIVVISLTAPGAKEFAVNAGEDSVNGDNPAAVAQRLLDERFPVTEGMPLLLVFHDEQGISSEADRARISAFSEWLDTGSGKPEQVLSAVPFHRMTASEQDRLLSEDRTTFMLNVALRKGLESDQTLDALDRIKSYWQKDGAGTIQLELTGPAAMSADTLTLFRNADVVLMLSTVVLILLLLIAIYRSPLLAFIPLAIAGAVYSVVDRALGLAGKSGMVAVDKQSLSIMMILLFAVLTDYCLFVFSRYREELVRTDSKYDAMGKAITSLAEPILFSGGTVLLAMLALFAAVFKPYQGFAPVFAIAIAVILLAGLTLIPAVFALLGRRAFWPFVPKPGLQTKRSKASSPARDSFWTKTGAFVTRRPKAVIAVIAAVLLLMSLNIGSIRYSFNLMNSFPEDMGSRQGFETLEKHYPPGLLAPVTVIVRQERPIAADAGFMGKIRTLADALKRDGAISTVAPDFSNTAELPESLLSDDRRSVKFQVILKTNPYDQEALNAVKKWRHESAALLERSGFDVSEASLHFAGKTSEQLDVRAMNGRDTVAVFTLVTMLIALMLAWQTRSIVLAFCMIATILLSYAATIGFSWLVFHGLLGYGTISYRLPMYTFVFMVALGVDYNIMLVSRVREEAARLDWREAVRIGVARTGGVISSAGLILAATFGVLMTQPLQELYLFGFAMTAGILVDTFLVRECCFRPF